MTYLHVLLFAFPGNVDKAPFHGRVGNLCNEVFCCLSFVELDLQQAQHWNLQAFLPAACVGHARRVFSNAWHLAGHIWISLCCLESSGLLACFCVWSHSSCTERAFLRPHEHVRGKAHAIEFGAVQFLCGD